MAVRKLVKDSSFLRDKIISFLKKFKTKNPSHAEGFFLHNTENGVLQRSY